MPELSLRVPQELLAELAEAPFLPESLHRFLPPAVGRLALPEPLSPPGLKRLALLESLSPQELSLRVPQELLAELAEAPFLLESLHRFLPPTVGRLALLEPLSPPDLPLLALPAYMLRIFVCISASVLAK